MTEPVTDVAGAKFGTCIDEWVVMADGVRLAVTLYLPDPASGTQPCILEALPYRKDDMTSSGYGPEYERLRDDYGYAVARLDLRGTGSSGGRATDEYPEQEQADLREVIAWLAAQRWCSGAVGMYGTSYSGFNALQMACERPPALKAICAIYATDDRYTDDVHYLGGVLKWLDLIDYCHYMTPMNALPPVPAVWGDGWREEWLARIAQHEPWLLTWMEHSTDGPYWRHGSVRPDYDRIECATMIVAGWADGYRNNSFRMMEALARNDVPRRLLAGPWAHASTASSLPGPRIDLVPEMARWWDRWLRGIDNGIDAEPEAVWYVRDSHRPAPDLDTVPGHWRAEEWPSPRAGTRALELFGRRPYAVKPDVGVDAWLSCAGHLPYGQPLDQRHDDAESLTWDFDADQIELAGNPLLQLDISADRSSAQVAVKLCDVFVDGTSTLITRGLLDLDARESLAERTPLVPGEAYDVTVELEATAWRFAAGHKLRLSIAGADWPNTAAPPEPVMLHVRAGTLVLPVMESVSPHPAPPFVTGDAAEAEGDEEGEIVWQVQRDVLARRTTCVVDHGSTYDAPYGSVTEHYGGRVSVDLRTFEQRAESDVTFTMRYQDPGVELTSRSTLDVRATAEAYDVSIELTCHDADVEVARRTWQRSFPRL